MAYQAKSYGRVYHNLYHLVPLYKRAKKDVGKNQSFKWGMNGPTFLGVIGGVNPLDTPLYLTLTAFYGILVSC